MVPSWGSAVGMFWIFPLLCLIFMVAMMFMMVRRGGGCMPMGRHGSSHDPRETPRQILDRRLAGGEITPDQYASMRRDIEAQGGQR